MIFIKDLCKSYGKNDVLKNINITFEKGKVYGIVGENGAGKTTLFRCLANLENYSGSIESDFKSLKDNLGYLMTESYFFTNITGNEYVRLLCNARKIDISNNILKDKNIFDLPLNDYVSTYSTGMKKKLALYAILLQDNQCFLLDEPYNGIDIHSNIIIVEIINKLKDLGKTVITASHIFSTLKDTCDEILHLKNNTIEKKVCKDDFDTLEEELKEVAIGNKINMLFNVVELPPAPLKEGG